MQKHYEIFKENLSKIQIDFKKLVDSQSSNKMGDGDKKTVSAKSVAIMIEKYMDEIPNMLYEILTRNLGKTEVSWDDLLKCLQDEFYLSYTVLKRQNRKFSISEAKWNDITQFNKILHYLKAKQTNYIQSIFKPNLGVNISQHSSNCDILAILLEKQILFYLLQENRIVCSFDFKYRNVKNKLIKKYEAKEVKKQLALRQNEGLDTMPISEFIHDRKMSFLQLSKNNSKNIRNSNKNMFSESKTQSANSKIGHRSRVNSNASSQVSSFLKRNSTDIGVSDWRKKLSNPKDTSLKIRTNTTKKVFQLFETSKLENSIEIAKKFQQARDNFERYIVLDKTLLEKQIQIGIQDVKIEKKSIDFKVELQKMKAASKSIQKQQKNNFFSQKSYSKQAFHHLDFGNNGKQHAKVSSHSLDGKNQNKRNSFFSTENRYQKSAFEEKQKFQSIEDKLLEDNKIGILSFSFYENFLLLSLYNREVRLYRIKKNLHRLKEELIFEKQNQNLVVFVQIYKSVLSQTYNMVLCSNRNSQNPVMKIYEIFQETLFSCFAPKDDLLNGKDSERQMAIKKNGGKDFKEIFCCRFSFDPMYENLNLLGIGAFNEKGYFSLVETNHISLEHKNQSLVKLFERQYTNLVTGEIISISACRAHTNQINIYFVCKNGFVYLVDKISGRIKLQKKICQCKILDISLIKVSTEILIVSERGELTILNSLNLEQMYFFETYMTLSQDSRLLSISENKFLFYSNRSIRGIDIEQNEQKLLEYQKPLKIYRNRNKIKRQQALLNKETGDIELKKHSVKLDDNRKSLQFLADEEARGSNLQKFSSKFNKRKIEQFFSINNSELPHYILVLQNGEVLVYDYKGEYFGSYLKKRHVDVRQAWMNKKMYYLAILYKESSIEVVNLYSQICIIRYPLAENIDQESSGVQGSLKQGYQNGEEEEEIFYVGFCHSSHQDSSSKADKNNSHSDFIFSIDKSLTLSIFNFKGVIIRTLNLSQQKTSFSPFNLIQGRRACKSVHLDKDGELIVGNEKGELIFYQKNTYSYIKAIKIAYYPIIEIQPLQKSSIITNSKERNKFLLILVSNNEIFLVNKENKIFNKVYTPHKFIQEQKLVEKENNITIFKEQIQQLIEENESKKLKDFQNTKISSVHYFSKVAAFTEKFVIYQWQQIYEKVKFYQIEQSRFESRQQKKELNIIKAIQNFVKSNGQTSENKNKKTKYDYKLHPYKKVGYLIEKIKPISSVLQHKMVTKEVSQSKNSSVESFLNSQNLHFLTVWDTEQFFVSQNSFEVLSRSHKDNQRNQKVNSSSSIKNKQTKNNALMYPFEQYCFAQGNCITIILEPQSQFLPQKNKDITKNKSLQKNRLNSKQNSGFISRKSSIDSISISVPLQLNEKTINGHNSKKGQKIDKTTIKVYDFQQFLSNFGTNMDKVNTTNRNELSKAVLVQEI